MKELLLKRINAELPVDVTVFRQFPFLSKTLPLSSKIMNFCARKNFEMSKLKNMTMPKNIRLYFDYAKGVPQLNGTFIQVKIILKKMISKSNKMVIIIDCSCWKSENGKWDDDGESLCCYIECVR